MPHVIRSVTAVSSEMRGGESWRAKEMRALVASAILLLAFVVSVNGATAREGQSSQPQANNPPNEKPQAAPKADNPQAAKPQNEKPPASKPENKPQAARTQGQFLVAGRGLGDPLFQESVVLMLPIKEGPLLVGLIINKASKIKVRDLFPDSPGLEANESMVYFGGPVDAGVGARSAIFRSKTPRDKATQVFGDVYVTFDPGVILELAENPLQASNVRVFVGRAQWAPEQFEGEVAAGAWHSLRGGADSIFTTLPEMLWHTLIDRAEPRPVVRNAPGFIPTPREKSNGRRPCQMNCVSASKSAAIS